MIYSSYKKIDLRISRLSHEALGVELAIFSFSQTSEGVLQSVTVEIISLYFIALVS